MILLIFNGYFRSGTTIFFRIISESNRETPVFYEPLTPDLFNQLTALEKQNIRLHGFHPWKCYKDFLNLEQLEIFKQIHKNICKIFANYGDNVPIDLSEVVDLFEFFNNLDKNVILQPNRCHFILSQLANKYKCTFIHIIRNPVDVWIGQTLEPLVLWGIKRAKLIYNFKNTFIGRYVLTKYLPNRKWVNGFAISENFSLMKDKFKLKYSYSLDPLDKMLVVWTYCNYHAFKQAEECDKGMVVYYEQVTKEPEKWFKIMSDFSGVNFDLKYAKILKPRITKDEKLRKHFVERLERLGLIDMVNEFYPPERWFG